VFAASAVGPRDRETFLARLRDLENRLSDTDESEWLLATDPPRTVHRRSAPMRNVLGEIVGRVDVYTDVTESRRLYTQLLSSERLRAVGEMASGVAHDFNNVLASIVGQTDLLQSEHVPGPARQAIVTIREAALDGARLLRNLHGLARNPGEVLSRGADLNATVQEAVDSSSARWAATALDGRGAVEVRVSLATRDLRPVAIDPGELREVLRQLLFNAAEAMPSGGRIDVSTRLARAPGSAEVEVRDTGHGIPEPVRGRIFEPFFSTRAGGSGLGLAVAYSIISRAGGEISVDSDVGSGSTFTIRLPFVSAGEPAAPARTPDAGRATARQAAQSLKGARILIADDEPGLVTIVRQLMERSGAQVTVASGGAAALDAIRDPRKHFDVVITDLDMPDVDGWAVTTEVRLRAPQTSVVMLTGWAGEIAPEDFKSRGVDVVLAKPCSRAELESAIARVLAQRQTPRTGLDLLLVDDEPALGRSIRDLLTMQGHRVTLVDSARAALEQLDQQQFDVVLTDYSLGETSGAQLAEQIEQRQARPYVVLITGYAVEIDDPSLMTTGVNAVLPKPARARDLRAVLSRVPPRAQ
jgi:signal transduction histidine kinase/CheY-like chemotaxis protein